MLNHVESASSAASAGVAISHSNMVTGAVGLASGGTALVIGNTSTNQVLEAGHWFTHAEIWIFIPSQICTILGTICTLICTFKIVYEFCRSFKSKPKPTKKQSTNTGPIIQGGSGSGHPKIDPK